jgi:hypothetical protein
LTEAQAVALVGHRGDESPQVPARGPLAPASLAFHFVAQVLLAFQSKLVTTQGKAYRGRACGRQRGDGLWEGWIEFVPDGGGRVIRTQRETTQPNLADLAYWATGLTPVYLEGALESAITAARRPSAATLETPAYDEPARASIRAGAPPR